MSEHPAVQRPRTSGEKRFISRGFAVKRIAVILDRQVYEYVLRQQGRLPQSKSASALIRDLLREHETLTHTLALRERRIRELERLLQAPRGRR